MKQSGRWKHTVETNIFYNYTVHILIPQNTESGQPELKNVGDKSKDKNELIIHNHVINSRWKQITDIIQGFEPIFQEN